MYLKLRLFLSFSFAILILSSLAFSVGTTGKLRGTVRDKQTQEPLIGANVVIAGTSQGASTDINGEYIILNVTPGNYTLRTSYLGYQSVNVSNVVVNIDLTTEQNFLLSSEAVNLQAVEIIAETPLVSKSATNTVVQMKSEQIENIPLRGVQNLVGMSGGVVSQGGNLYVRGGRTGEMAFYVDGVLVNNPMNHQNQLTLSTEAIEEVSTQIGGMTAEYGNALSGVVNTTTKIGTSKYSVTAEAITDGFLSGTKKYLNTYSYGQNEYVVSVGGPVIPGNNSIKFFVAGTRIFNRSNPTWLDGVNLPFTVDSNRITGADFIVTNRDSGLRSSVADGTTGRRGALANALNNLDLKGGREFGGLQNDSWNMNGNVYFDLKSLNVKIGGTYATSLSFGTASKGLNALRISDNTFRPGKTVNEDISGYAKLTYLLDPKTYFTVNAGYYSFFQEQGDAYLFDNYKAYGDPNNKYNGYLNGPSKEPPTFTLYGFQVNSPGFMSQKNYIKNSRTSLSGRMDFVSQMSNSWEFKVGAEIQRYTIRSYNMPAFSFAKSKFDNPTASDWEVYTKTNVNFYGYDIYGEEFDGGTFTDKTGTKVDLSNEGPRNPIMFGAYVQNKIEMSDLIINAGLRFDYIDPGTKKYKNSDNIQTVDINGVPILSSASLVDADKTLQLSPRIGFSFPVTDKTVFHSEYGKFIALSSLNDLYDTRLAAGRFLSGGLARQYPNPNLKPERTTDYQLGFRQQLGDVSAFDLSFFYKDTRDLIVIRQVYPAEGATHGPYISNVNGDYGTIRGLTFRFDVRRTNRIALTANYTIQNALATGSATGTHFNIAWQDGSGDNGRPYFPVIPSPTDFDRTHFGNVSFDYRFTENDGPTMFDNKILQRAGVNLLFTFTSGIRYTKDQVSSFSNEFSINAPIPYENLNSSTAPWNFNLDLKANKVVVITGGIDLDVYVWISNVLNTKSITNVYSATGLPDNDGFFTTDKGTTFLNTHGEDGKKLYDYLVDNLGNYSAPRVIRLGAKLSF